MSDSNFSAIRARLKYETVEDFIGGYARFISGGGMFIPMRPSKLKPIGTIIRFQFLLGDGTTALLGEGSVLQVRAPDDGNPKAPVGMLIKFTKLSQDSKALVDRIVSEKGSAASGLESQIDDEDAAGLDKETSPGTDAATPVSAREYQPTPVQEAEESVEVAAVEADESREDITAENAYENDAAEFDLDADAPDESEPEAAEDDGFELDLGEDWDDEESPEEEASPDLETAEFADSPTREAPDASQLEPPTAESEAEDEADEPPAEEGGPRKLAGTKGGLQVLAFDDMSDEELEEFQAFSFGEDDEDEFDDMFDGLFGGSDAADDFLGGAFGGGDEDASMKSQEIELPEEDDELDALLGEGQLDEPSVAEVEAAAAIMGSEEDSEGVEDDLEDESEVEFVLDDAADDDEAQEFDLGLDDTPDEEPDEADEPMVDDEDDLDALIDFQKSPYEHSAPEIGAHARDDEPEEEEEQAGELESLLGSLDSDEEPEMTLNIGSAAHHEDVEDDEESLEALLASAQKEIEEKQSAPEEDPNADILDQLLGDEDELPPPPADTPSFSLPDGNKKKKGGFISKLFGKD